MLRVSTGHSELDVTVQGEGEPVLFIHGAFFGGVFDALRDEPSLRDRYRLITYDRHGYGESSKPEEPFGLEDVVADALTVLQRVGGDRGHVVAHSVGGVYGLQFALDYPDVVHTLTLIEPVLPTAAWAEFLAQHFVPAGEALAGGDTRTALDLSFGAVYGGTNYRSEMDPMMPEGWYEQAVDDLDYLFRFESPAARQFSFGAEEATRIHQPMLLMRGDSTVPIWVNHHEQMKEWIPHAREHVVPDANHMVQVLNPGDTARTLSSFLASHRIDKVDERTG